MFRKFAAGAFVAVSVAVAHAASNDPQKFFPDDPIWKDPETQNAAAVRPTDLSELHDFLENSFRGSGERVDKPAVNINTLGEVPDSSWFTNRAGRRALTVDELVRGPDTGPGPTGDRWTILAGKTEGITPGMEVQDAAGQKYFIKFDPPSNPEMASGAEVVATKFFHAFGYHVPENYIASIRRESLAIGPDATVDEGAHKRRMEMRDVDAVLKKAAQNADGSYRVLASKALPGTAIGPFRYSGTRPDDPNDIFPHEHRRELRGLGVFAAWLNHDDSSSGNTLDTLVHEGSRSVVRHHLIDFGSAFGSGSTRAQSIRAGNEYIWESRPTFVTMLTLGFYVRPWIKVDYPDIPAIGRFESTYFRPEEWKPEYPNPAFRNGRPDDRFWAARIVAALSESDVRAIVSTARFTDPRATGYMTETLLARKAKVLRAWLNDTNPLVDIALSRDGELTFQNAAEKAAVAPSAERYTVQWARFDNATRRHEAVGDEQTVTTSRAQAPAALLASRPPFISATLRAFHAEYPAWAQPLVAYFRHAGGDWQLVGLERNP